MGAEPETVKRGRPRRPQQTAGGPIRGRAAKVYQRRGFPPEKVAEQIVAAILHDRVVVPVTPEAKAGLAMSRLSPSLMRRLARVERPGA